MKNGIIPLQSGDSEHVHAVVDLHENLLKDSLVPALGRGFMEKFYYKKLTEKEWVRCLIYWYEGRAVAFSAYTEYPFSFMKEGRRGHHFLLMRILTAAILTKPSRAFVILELLKGSQRRALEPDGKTGELLSFGVLPESAFLKDPVTGKRLSQALFERTAEYFKARGFLKLQMVIRKDNLPSLLFFRSYGAVPQSDDFSDPKRYRVSMDL